MRKQGNKPKHKEAGSAVSRWGVQNVIDIQEGRLKMQLSAEGRIEATAVWLIGDPCRSFILESHQGQHGGGRECRMMR